MSKKELENRTKDALFNSTTPRKDAFVAAMNTMVDMLIADKKVHLKNFGTFTVVSCEASVGVNPRTGERITIPAKNKVRFKPSPILKANINP